MAKIHTVEWTPGILANPVLKMAMNANWYGVLPAWVKKLRPHRHARDAERHRRLRAGPPLGAVLDHRGVRLGLPAAPADPGRLRVPLALDRRADRERRSSTPIQGRARATDDKHALADLYYSLGVAHPGAITLHNHPRALQNHTRIDGDRVDIGTIDILRDRERGVPRYNDFREKLRKPRIKKFEDLTENQDWVAQIKDVYDGDIDMRRPPGRAAGRAARRRASASATPRSGSSS